MLARLNGLCGGVFADESFTLSRSYYYGRLNDEKHRVIITHRIHVIEGRPLDTLGELDAGAIGRSATVRSGTGPNDSARADLEELTRRIISGESLHPGIARIVGNFARRGVPIEGCLFFLSTAFQTARISRYEGRWDEVVRTTQDIYAKEAEKRDQAKSSTERHDAGDADDPPPAGNQTHSHIWRSKDCDFSCAPTGVEHRNDADGRIYAKVGTGWEGEFRPKG